MKFYLAIVTLCVVALSVQAAAPISAGKDEVKKAFHQMMAAIDKALTQAQAALDKAMTSVKAEATKVEDKAKGELDKVLQPLRKKLDDLVEKAKEKGFDVATCQNYVDDFSKTPDNLVHNLIDCVNQQISKAQGYVDDALNNAKKMEADLNSIDSDIDNCGGNFVKKAKCYAKILEEIIEDTKSAPQHIIEDITKTTALVTGIVPNLEQCSINQLKKAGEDAAEDVAEFAICAAL